MISAEKMASPNWRHSGALRNRDAILNRVYWIDVAVSAVLALENESNKSEPLSACQISVYNSGIKAVRHSETNYSMLSVGQSMAVLRKTLRHLFAQVELFLIRIRFTKFAWKRNAQVREMICFLIGSVILVTLNLVRAFFAACFQLEKISTQNFRTKRVSGRERFKLKFPTGKSSSFTCVLLSATREPLGSGEIIAAGDQ